MQSIINRRSSLPILLLLCSFVLTSCLDSSDPEPLGNLHEEADRISDFSTFVGYLSDTGAAQLDSTIAQENELTVLIPTNEAFDDLPSGTLDTLSEEGLTEVLRYHIIEEIVDLNALAETEDIGSMQGDNLYFEIVPNNQGGANLFINNSQYLTAFSAENGFIYAVDQVLLPDSYHDVTGLIAKRYQLNELEEAIGEAAGLESTLEDPNAAFTVFAPSDEALDGTTPSGSQIEYHIIEEKLTSAELSSQTYTTMNGEEIEVDASGTITINNGEATVTTMDIEGTNGVVHIIDGVLEAPSE